MKSFITYALGLLSCSLFAVPALASFIYNYDAAAARDALGDYWAITAFILPLTAFVTVLIFIGVVMLVSDLMPAHDKEQSQ